MNGCFEINTAPMGPELIQAFFLQVFTRRFYE